MKFSVPSFQIFTLSGLFILGACASSKPEHYQAYAPSTDPSAELSTLKGHIAEANTKQTDVLVPGHFEQAMSAHDKAEKLRSENKDNEKVLESIAESKAHLQKANEVAAIRREFRPQDADVLKDGDNVLIRLKNISFKKNDASLRPEQLAVLSKVQDAVQILAPSSVVVEGHTDSTGTAAINKTLSEERAKVVETYLVTSGSVPADKISSVGYGFEKPVSANKSAKGRAVNRRIDVVLEM